MKLALIPLALIAALGLAASAPRAWSADPPAKIRVLVVHGGHGFETNQFLQIFKDNDAITFEVAAHPKAQEALKAGAAPPWDVLVLYDMWQEISDEAKADWVARLKEGKGLVALHHALASYQDWPEYARIIGGKYHLKKWLDGEVEKPGSTYKHGVKFQVKIANPQHPVTRGLTENEIEDETYGGFQDSPHAHALLTTEEPTSGRTIAWAKTYEAARVIYIQLGHDHLAYENPSYRRLLAQAIAWVARRD